MNREQAIAIAVAAAKAKPESYYSEPFIPHEWVIDAILAASPVNAPHTEVIGWMLRDPKGGVYFDEVCIFLDRETAQEAADQMLEPDGEVYVPFPIVAGGAAPAEVTDALMDSQYAAGMLLGWNLCLAGKETEFNDIRSARTAGACKAIKEAAAPCERVVGDGVTIEHFEGGVKFSTKEIATYVFDSSTDATSKLLRALAAPRPAVAAPRPAVAAPAEQAAEPCPSYYLDCDCGKCKAKQSQTIPRPVVAAPVEVTLREALQKIADRHSDKSVDGQIARAALAAAPELPK